MVDLRRIVHAARLFTTAGALSTTLSLTPFTPHAPSTIVAAASNGGRAAGDDIVRAASAAQPAERGSHDAGILPPAPSVANPALAGCDAPLLQRLMESNPTASQWIMVVVPTESSTTGTLSIATVRGSAWQCTLAPTPAQVGSAGIRPLLQRRSGDGTTPSGIFPLGIVTSPQGPISFFGNSPDPGALGPYRRIQPGDCYGANPNTPGYGHWRVDSTNCTGDDELLQLNVQTYEHAVVIGANTEPDVSGDAPGEPAYASAIFLHRTGATASGATKPTSGCVSVGHAQLVTALRSIDPALRPRFAIGTRADLLATPVLSAPARTSVLDVHRSIQHPE